MQNPLVQRVIDILETDQNVEAGFRVFSQDDTMASHVVVVDIRLNDDNTANNNLPFPFESFELNSSRLSIEREKERGLFKCVYL